MERGGIVGYANGNKLVLAAAAMAVLVVVLVGGAVAGAADNYVAVRGMFGWAQEAERTSEGGSGSTISFDSAYGGTVAVGRGITPWLRIEGEAGYVYMSLDKMKRHKLGDQVDVSGHDRQFTLMVNAYLEWPNQSPFKPFIGAGVGMVNAKLDLSFVHPANGSVVKAGDAVWAFAYQFIAGASWRINDMWEVEFMYRYYLTTDRTHSNHGTATYDEFELEGTRASMIFIGGRLRF